MKLLYRYLSIVTVIVVLSACTSPEKLLAKGNYSKAITKAAKAYNKKPQNAALLQVAADAYNLEQQKLLGDIQLLQQQNNELKYEKILNNYRKLQSYYQVLLSNKNLFAAAQPTDFKKEIAEATNVATDVRFDRGMNLLAGSNKRDFQDAYYEFEKANKLTPGDAAIKQKMEEAYQLGVTNVAVVPVSFDTRLPGRLRDIVANNYDHNLMRFLVNNQSKRFLKFYTIDEAVSSRTRTDEQVVSTFKRLIVPRYSDNISKRRISKETTKSVMKDGKTITQTEVIRAELLTTVRRINPQARLLLSIVDHNNRAVWSTVIDEEVFWEHSWTSYTGNKEALSAEDLRLLSAPPQNMPSDQQLMEQLLQKIGVRVNDALQKAYRDRGY